MKALFVKRTDSLRRSFRKELKTVKASQRSDAGVDEIYNISGTSNIL
jgi:hypothetical protein